MANTVNLTFLEEGPSIILLHVYMQADGVTGEVANFPLLTPSAMTPPIPPGRDFQIQSIWYELYGFTAILGFEGVPTGLLPLWALSPGASQRHDWQPFGGLTDRTTNATGRLLMSTNGFTSTSSIGTFVLRCRKNVGGA